MAMNTTDLKAAGWKLREGGGGYMLHNPQTKQATSVHATKDEAIAAAIVIAEYSKAVEAYNAAYRAWLRDEGPRPAALKPPVFEAEKKAA